MVQAHAYELLNQKEANGVKPRRIFQASQRLTAALDRLEGNLQSVTTQQARDIRQNEQIGLFERENQALKQERDKLSGAIEQLEYEYDDLQKVASAIYNKLDDSIKRLTQIIES